MKERKPSEKKKSPRRSEGEPGGGLTDKGNHNDNSQKVNPEKDVPEGKPPNHPKAVEFLQRYRPGGPWVLTAITVDQKTIETDTFTEENAVLEWLFRKSDMNHYFHVNPTIRALKKKASREDIAAVTHLHIDLDPRAGEDITEERERAERILRAPARGIPPASIIIDSGGGFQGFWILKDPIKIDGKIPRAEDAKRYNLQLEVVFAADNCHNIDRIMRLPGTVNWPNERKKAKGRVPTLAELVVFDESRVYKISEFKKSPPPEDSSPTVQISENVKRLASVEDLPPGVSEKVKVLIVHGEDPEDPTRFPSRSEALFYVCLEMVRAGCDNDTIYSVITDPKFKISESVLDKGSGMERYARRQIERAREEANNPWLSDMNERHAIIKNFGGKCVIFTEYDDKVEHQSFDHFNKAHLRRKVVIGKGMNGEPIPCPIGKAWLTSPAAREYERAIFLPGKEAPEDIYNLFRGWRTLPKEGDCHLFLEYLREVVCGGVEEYYDWLMNWLAHMFQRPWEPPEIAVALRGRQGVGKSYFPDRLGDILGPYYIAVHNQQHLTGNFNAHTKDKLLLFGDEVFGSASKTVQGVLKAMVTQKYHLVEPKGIDGRMWPKYYRLVIASNEGWVVPADNDDRRFFVLDVKHPLFDDGVAKNEYFRKIQAEWDEGGKEAFLHELLARDISGFDHRSRPLTEALTDQKTFTFTGPKKYMFNGLKAGSIPGHLVDGERIFVATGLWLQELGLDKSKETALGNELRSASAQAHSRKETIDGKRKNGYWLPSLLEARALWAENNNKLKIRWPEDINSWESVEEKDPSF